MKQKTALSELELKQDSKNKNHLTFFKSSYFIIALFFSLILFLTFSFADSPVFITPSDAYSPDALTCSLSSGDPSAYAYNWYRNGELTSYTSYILPEGVAFPGERWTCKVYYPPTEYTGLIYIGESSVLVKYNNAPLISFIKLDKEVINSAPGSYFWTSSYNNPSSSISITDVVMKRFNFSVSAYDVENQSLSYNWFLDGSLIYSGKNYSIEFSSPIEKILRLEVSDGRKTSSVEWLLNINSPTIYGVVYDENGNPVPGANISFYDSSVYDPFNGTGNYEDLEPKTVPDAVTNLVGGFFMFIDDGVKHMVVQHSDEKDFDIRIKKGKKGEYDDDCDSDGKENWEDDDDELCDKKSHDVEMNENISKTNFNAEGHVLYSGKYEHSNNYTCGDKLKFTMFGVNNGDTNETITFLIQDHTSIAGPSAPIFYEGNISNPDESLTINAGEKKHKTFYYTLPCPMTLGRYDVHVVWNGEKWHKIGNFFVINDTVPPALYSEHNLEMFSGGSDALSYSVNNIYEEGTVNHYEILHISPYIVEGVIINVDKDITVDSNGDSIADNDPDYSFVDPWDFGELNISYNESGRYVARLFAMDASNNTAEEFVNVSVYASEDEADVVATALWTLYGYGGVIEKDYNYTVGTSTPRVRSEWDIIYPGSYGSEYLTPGNGLDSPDGINATQVAALERVNYVATGPEYVKPIYPMTLDEFNYTLDSFFYLLKCVIGELNPNIICSAKNFAPQIWRCSPSVYLDPFGGYLCKPYDLSITSSSTQNFAISVADPNNDAYTTYWYVDGVLNKTGGNSYSFVADSSLIGKHVIKAISLDSSGENVSITNGPINSIQWNLEVTA